MQTASLLFLQAKYPDRLSLTSSLLHHLRTHLLLLMAGAADFLVFTSGVTNATFVLRFTAGQLR